MGGKKPTKHSATDLAKRQNAARIKQVAEKGKDGRTATKCNFNCKICMASVPDVKTMGIHYESKHPKETFPQADYEAMKAAAAASHAETKKK
mmetsp:Transcript_74640/g.103730  ORF Transcript_74640/g.103730 Transcript_74640/m.103730 type:complete len:92 (+) Transcript_74640:24-299(+)